MLKILYAACLGLSVVNLAQFTRNATRSLKLPKNA